MARLNVIKTVEGWHAKINPRYDLDAAGILEIRDHNHGPIQLIFSAFTYGYAQGHKAAIAEMKKSKGM